MTFTIKIRGGTGLVLAEYLCPKHGRFELLVERDAKGDPPEIETCQVPVTIDDDFIAAIGGRTGMSRAEVVESMRGMVCGRPSPWTISAPAVHTQFVITASKGKNASKPHPKAMDTRMLAEGRKNDYRRQRKKIKEEERHARVKRLLS